MMNKLEKNKIFSDIFSKIKAAKTIALGGHDNPDGDCLGSILGLGLVLESMGKEVDLLSDEKPDHLSYIPAFDRLKKQDPNKKYDIFIRLDLGARNRMKNSIKAMDNSAFKINFDHHLENDYICDLTIHDPTASSTCQLVAEFLFNQQISISKEAATALYSGLITDSNRYLYDTASAETLEIGAGLLRAGADDRLIYLKEYQEEDPNFMAFTGQMIEEADFFHNGKVIAGNITIKKIEKYGLTMSEAESVVDRMRNLKGVELAVVMKEQNDKLQKLSFRSKLYYNVAELAGNFQGGGHMKAAGGRILTNNKEAYKELLAFLKNLDF